MIIYRIIHDSFAEDDTLAAPATLLPTSKLSLSLSSVMRKKDLSSSVKD